MPQDVDATLGCCLLRIMRRLSNAKVDPNVTAAIVVDVVETFDDLAPKPVRFVTTTENAFVNSPR